MKILVVEDEKMLAESIKNLLEAKGFTVETAYDGEDGTEYALLGIYDLLILDVMMPKMNGYQVAKEVRAKRCSTPILMLTAKSELEDRIKGLNAGADYYLTKPFNSRELLACINALLRRQGDQVDEMVYGNTSLDLEATENHVEVYVGFLRKKLRSIGSNIRIESIRKLGYHLEIDEEC